MALGARAKFLLIAAGFALPIAASLLAYFFVRPAPTANYGELLLPPQHVTAQSFTQMAGGDWRFDRLEGRWALVVSDSGECPAACEEKLTLARQARLALGRNAERVLRVYVVDDLQRPDPRRLEAYEGTLVVLTPTGAHVPPGAANDRAHIYLVDPHGNVVMRWPVGADGKRVVRDLERLLKASQIG
jgi:cytochrome oxidase Cu insertion factor (SCO1/SenC/PrrC family)